MFFSLKVQLLYNEGSHLTFSFISQNVLHEKYL